MKKDFFWFTFCCVAGDEFDNEFDIGDNDDNDDNDDDEDDEDDDDDDDERVD
jgi:nucleosome assembly protein 1-like 1